VSDTADLAEGMMTMLSTIEPIREAVLGYRESLLQDGISGLCADAMASQLHANLMDLAFAPSLAEARQPKRRRWFR
jgi:hypothetical protein